MIRKLGNLARYSWLCGTWKRIIHAAMNPVRLDGRLIEQALDQPLGLHLGHPAQLHHISPLDGAMLGDVVQHHLLLLDGGEPGEGGFRSLL